MYRRLMKPQLRKRLKSLMTPLTWLLDLMTLSVVIVMMHQPRRMRPPPKNLNLLLTRQL